nr:RecName: Full=Putative uncharacterized protein encoded by LINC00162; AltName: Full=Putative narcolepsy candidate region 1 gene C protein; Short=NLC1-C [Homo sapiens]
MTSSMGNAQRRGLPGAGRRGHRSAGCGDGVSPAGGGWLTLALHRSGGGPDAAELPGLSRGKFRALL